MTEASKATEDSRMTMSVQARYNLYCAIAWYVNKYVCCTIGLINDLILYLVQQGRMWPDLCQESMLRGVVNGGLTRLALLLCAAARIRTRWTPGESEVCRVALHT